MSIHRYAARKDANEGDIVEALRAAGAYVWIIGLPTDLLVGFTASNGPGMFLVECKILTGKRKPRAAGYTDLQKDFMLKWPGPEVVTVTSPEEALYALASAQGLR
jgi:hypothetical protein